MYKYSSENLINYASTNNIILCCDYSNTKLNAQSKIEAICYNSNCDNTYKKQLRTILDNGIYCKKCTIKKGITSVINQRKEKNGGIFKYSYEYLINFCSKNNINLLDDYNNVSFNPDMRIFFICTNNNCNNNVNKSIRVLYEKHTLCLWCYKKEAIKKREKTNLNKYKVKYISQNKTCKLKQEQTNYIKYGYSIASKNKNVINKMIDTKLKRYGSLCINSYNMKNYLLPSGNIIKIQGYEHFALNTLLQECNEKNIITGVKNVPIIYYYDIDNKKRRHYPDIYINNLNKLIEVKSDWTLNQNYNNNIYKQKYAKKQGYLYEIWIYNKSGKLIKKII